MDTHDVKRILSLGNKFAVPATNESIPILKILVDVEDAIKLIPTNEADPTIANDREIIRSQVANILNNVRNKHESKSPINRFIMNAHQECKFFLKQHPEIIVTVADKGGATLIMNKSEYETKMKQLLDDTNTYKILDRSPLNRLENRSNGIVNKLHDCVEIDWIKKARMRK